MDEDPPVEPKWEQPTAPKDAAEVEQYKQRIANQVMEKRIRLLAQQKAELVPEINIAVQALLKNTNMQVL